MECCEIIMRVRDAWMMMGVSWNVKKKEII